MHILEQRIPSGVLILIAGAIAVAVMVAAVSLGALGSPQAALATHHGACTGGDPENLSIEGTDDSVTHTDADGDNITGVCLKAGNTETHTFFDQNGAGDCYTIRGIGSSTVTVEKTGPDPPCQDISHIDVLTGPAPAPTPTPTATPPAEATPTPTPTPTVLGEIQEPQPEGPQALPESGGAPAGGSGSYFPLLLALGGLALLGGAGTFAVAVARRRR